MLFCQALRQFCNLRRPLARLASLFALICPTWQKMPAGQEAPAGGCLAKLNGRYRGEAPGEPPAKSLIRQVNPDAKRQVAGGNEILPRRGRLVAQPPRQMEPQIVWLAGS